MRTTEKCGRPSEQTTWGSASGGPVGNARKRFSQGERVVLRDQGALASAASTLSTAAEASLFPQLASRYPVGDPAAANPLDPTREGPKAVAAGDLNGDGLGDVVGDLDGSVSVLLARKGGGMEDQAYYRAGGSIRPVVVADVNRDGNLDVAAADITRGVSILLGSGDGTLTRGGLTPFPMARSLAAEDVSGDGVIDLLAATSVPDCESARGGSMAASVLVGRGFRLLAGGGRCAR